MSQSKNIYIPPHKKMTTNSIYDVLSPKIEPISPPENCQSPKFIQTTQIKSDSIVNWRLPEAPNNDRSNSTSWRSNKN